MTTSIANTSFLIVEDNPYDLHALHRSLSKTFSDWTVYGASSLHHLENVISQTHPTIGIVDYHLPDATGIEVIETLKQTVGNIPLIMVTGGIDATEAAQALKLGATDYVEKDDKGQYLQKITQSVKDILEQPQYVQLETAQYRQLMYSNALLTQRSQPHQMAQKARNILQTTCKHYPQHMGGVLYKLLPGGGRRMLASYSVGDLTNTYNLETYKLDLRIDDHLAAQLILFKHPQADQLSLPVKDVLHRELTSLLRQEKSINRLREKASHDALTGALNRHMLMPNINKELARMQRTKLPLSVLMLDLDHFKTVNDQHGHLSGDNVLRQFADLVRLNLRLTDTFIRYGGEEFIVLLPETEGTLAARIAERIRLAVSAHTFFSPENTPISVTVSIGYTTASDGKDNPMQLISAADTGLYEAKENGRNQVKLGTWKL